MCEFCEKLKKHDNIQMARKEIDIGILSCNASVELEMDSIFDDDCNVTGYRMNARFYPGDYNDSFETASININYCPVCGRKLNTD